MIGLIIILGIMWLYKKCSTTKEGLSTDGLGDRISAATTNAINAELVNSGMDPVVADAQAGMDIQGAVDTLFASLTGMVDNEIASMSDTPFEEVTDSSGVVIETRPEICTDPNRANCTDTSLFITDNKSFFKGNSFGDGFCEINDSNPVTLNQKCGRMTAENCNATDCCIWLNGSKCVAGSKSGPLFTTADGADMDYSYYSHKNTCYGSCGTGIANSANSCTAFNETDTNISVQCLNRLWEQTGCPNKEYITSNVVYSLKDYTKKAIKQQFKDMAMEENYSKCYGTDQAKWPAPCDGSTQDSFGLSARCMSKLFKDAGCTDTSMFTQAYVEEKRLEPKSALIDTFEKIKNTNTISSFTRCYGPDEIGWPNPCNGVSGDTLFKDVPQPCAHKMWRDATNSKCPNPEFIDSMYLNKEFQVMPKRLVKRMLEEGESTNDGYSSNRAYCQGLNPNKWSDVTAILPDPCTGIDWNTKLEETSMACRQRIADLYRAPTSDEGTQITKRGVVKSRLLEPATRGLLADYIAKIDKM